MAEQDTKKADARRPAENFVAKLVPDPASPPDLMRLAGYRGASSMEGHTRLYANPELSVYWDIPEGDVVHEQPVPPDADPLGAVVLWIKRDSKVVSNLSQQAQGGQQTMNAFTGSAATAQAPNLPTITATETFPRTITPACISPHYFCPPHSLLPYQCQSQFVLCPPSPWVICQVSPLPHCLQPVSPNCTPTVPTTIPTTIPTTVQTGSPVAQQFAAQAAPQAAPQALTLGATATHLSANVYCVSPLQGCFPSEILWQCHPSYPIHCTYTPASPYCTPPTIHMTVQTGSPVAQQFAAQAAPQAATATVGGFTIPHTLFCPPPSVPLLCTIPHTAICPTIPHTVLCHSPLVLCASPVTPISPNCPTTIPTTIPTTVQTGSPVAQQAAAQAAPQAAAPALTAVTATHFSANVHCVSPLQGCFPSEILWQCHPSFPIYCPVTLTPTVTRTIGTYGTYY